MRLIAVMSVIVLTGCMTAKTAPPVNLALVPNDCQNIEIIADYLQRQAALPRQILESEQDYEFHRRQIRAKIWDMRYRCRPV
jgi:hypothetical protein